MRRKPAQSIAAILALVTLLLISALPHADARQATPVATPIPADEVTNLPPPWLEFGPDGKLFARVIVDGPCPPLLLDAIEVAMTPRAPASEEFPVVACEATVPSGAGSAEILDVSLPLPTGPPLRIAVIGDTGCRLDDWGNQYQSCNDPTAWPFAQVASAVAAWHPDLILHVGDYLYRESPCPAGISGCAGSPHGDTWPTWNADFFAPVSPLLSAAPWVFMRGNHETCGRNPVGWFAYLDPRPYQAQCQQFTEPYVTTIHGLSLAVLDSAEAADTKSTPEEQTQYARQFDLLAAITPPGAWLVTHRPVHGILEGEHGEFEVANAAYEAATGGSLKADYGLILSGHIHLAESLAFADATGRAPQLISGNAGTALDDIPTASHSAGQLGDPAVTEAETLSAFGFLTLEPGADVWIATQRGKNGESLLECALALPEITCAAPDAEE